MPAGCSVSCPHYFKLWIRAGEEKCAHPQDSCYSTDNSTFSRRLPAPGVFRVFGSLMGLDLLLTSPTKRRIRMSGMLRGRRAANCTNRHCFHLALHLSVSALKDGLISSAPGLRFKHLSSSPPSLPPPLSASQCLPESLPFCLPLLQAWWAKTWWTACSWEALGWMAITRAVQVIRQPAYFTFCTQIQIISCQTKWDNDLRCCALRCPREPLLMGLFHYFGPLLLWSGAKQFTMNANELKHLDPQIYQ